MLVGNGEFTVSRSHKLGGNSSCANDCAYQEAQSDVRNGTRRAWRRVNMAALGALRAPMAARATMMLIQGV